jgi:hypothetical protein
MKMYAHISAQTQGVGTLIKIQLEVRYIRGSLAANFLKIPVNPFHLMTVVTNYNEHLLKTQ